jgi:hypothetical protein
MKIFVNFVVSRLSWDRGRPKAFCYRNHDLKRRDRKYCCVIAAMSITGVNGSGGASRAIIASTTAGIRWS